MAFFARLKSWIADRLSSEPSDPDRRRIGYSGRTGSGVYVTSDNALQIATVWACLAYLSQTVGQLPWRVLRPARGKRGEAVPTHRIDYLLHVRPNPEWSAFQFKETLVHWAARYGNGYAEIGRDTLGNAVALWPIHPDRVDPQRDPAGALQFVVNNGTAGSATIPAVDMFHLRGYGDGPIGVNVMEYAAESIGWARAVQIFGAAFYGNGMNLAGVIQSKKGLTPEALAELEARLEKKFKGAKRSGKWAVLDAEMEAKSLTVEPNKGQFIETNQHMVEEICRWFRVPPHKVMHLLRATFSNIEHQAIEVVVDSITPWVLRLEQEADYKLFGQNRIGYFTKMNLRALLRGDFKTQQEGFEIMRRNGTLNGDEWRDLVDMDPLPADAGGEKYIVQGQMIELAQVGARATTSGTTDPTAPAATPSPSNMPLAPDELAAMRDLEIMAEVQELTHV